ncbi:hypothetical protein FOMPIDRAFT_1015766 [Fomitopsis schrenkii]|uniref:Uncharacterized protein n=1 Tax=Fomitopsis schrenkii TaxID=2126942 RepID=S8FJY5_FOMSC|nr:hypothetical protein FOMPIDRAFT_1015766 [Fomitopsis schrenkii]
MAEHMQGRAEVNKVRATIQQAREAGTSSRVAGNGQPTEYVKAKHAAARLKAAKTEFSDTENQINSRLEAISKSQREAAQLQDALDSKRRVLMLMQVLEEKETFRMFRVKEVDRLLGQLQIDPVNAALHAYHIRLSRTESSDGQRHDSAEARRRASEARLRAALGESNADLFESCQRIARSRAARDLQYESPLPPPSRQSSGADDADLNEMHARVTEKERNLQRLLDEVADLEKACTQNLQALSAFDELTRPALRESLQEEVKVIAGYVDLMRLSIIKSADDEDRPHDESILGGKTWKRALLDVQARIEQAHTMDIFCQGAPLLSALPMRNSNDDSAALEELIASHRVRQDQVDERNTSLLARKLEKAKYGDALGAQIEKLVSEKDIIAALTFFQFTWSKKEQKMRPTWDSNPESSASISVTRKYPGKTGN